MYDTVSQPLELGDVTGRLIAMASVDLSADLHLFPIIIRQHIIRILVQTIPKPSITDKLISLATTALSLLYFSWKETSVKLKRRCSKIFSINPLTHHKPMTPASPSGREFRCPKCATFKDAYKVLSLPLFSSR
jgi:hypothetical protein